MAQVIIIDETVSATTATTIELDGVLRTKPIKAINSAVQIDATSTTIVSVPLTVVTDTPDASDEIQLVDENTVKVYLATAMVCADSIIMNVEFEDELIRT